MGVLANAKHEAVALAFIADPERIGWRAYKSVYAKSSQHAAETAWSRLLKDAEFDARIKQLLGQAADETVMDAREVLLELSKLGRANMLDYMVIGADGLPRLAFGALNRAQAAAIGELTVDCIGTHDTADGDDDVDGDLLPILKVKFKLAPKTPALELLAKHHKLLTEKHEHADPDGRGVGTQAAETMDMTDLARRVAFTLAAGARSTTARPTRAGGARAAARRPAPKRKDQAS